MRTATSAAAILAAQANGTYDQLVAEGLSLARDNFLKGAPPVIARSKLGQMLEASSKGEVISNSGRPASI